jgi:hypothetical protein
MKARFLVEAETATSLVAQAQERKKITPEKLMRLLEPHGFSKDRTELNIFAMAKIRTYMLSPARERCVVQVARGETGCITLQYDRNGRWWVNNWYDVADMGELAAVLRDHHWLDAK